MCVCVFEYVVVYVQVLCFTNHLLGETNPTGTNGTLHLAAPKETEIPDSQGTELCCMEIRKCIEYACPDCNVKTDFLLTSSYVCV